MTLADGSLIERKSFADADKGGTSASSVQAARADSHCASTRMRYRISANSLKNGLRADTLEPYLPSIGDSAVSAVKEWESERVNTEPAQATEEHQFYHAAAGGS